MSAHTPGPWCQGSSDLRVSMISVHAVNTAARHSTLARMVLPIKGGLTYDEIEANARLIAAAPELLEALKAVQTFIEGKPDAVEPFGMVRAAIAKATGEAQ
jgi:hypothetical protein